jgi:carbon monoxide dehydrogenase subunit G
MTNIKSKKETIQAPASKIYSFLSDFNNLEKLMPSKVRDWKSTVTTCSFTIEGVAKLNMVRGENTENKLVHMRAEGKNPFHYDLNTHINSLEKNNVEVFVELNADMNPMIALMAKKPLENFVNFLVDKLKKQMS